jgi:hypothetical protein
METQLSAILQAVDAAVLTPVVRQALGRDGFEIGEWKSCPIGGGVGNPVSVGLFRFSGSGLDGLGSCEWSVILKGIQSPANLGLENMGGEEDPCHWNYWKRELLLYQSDLLHNLPEGLSAPRCCGAVELEGGQGWLWLEDVSDDFGGPWSVERYALTARHLGRLNGKFAGEIPASNYPWLGRNMLPHWCRDLKLSEPVPWDHPLFRHRFPLAERNPFRRLLAESDRFLERLDSLPKTLCHGDTYPTNFMSRSVPGCAPQTIALDWALASFAPLGDDLGQLVLGAQTILPETPPEQVEQALFESYLAGLQDSGCGVDPKKLRFGYSASAALRVGIFSLYMTNEAVLAGETPEEIAGEAAPGVSFEARMASQAYELLEWMG